MSPKVCVPGYFILNIFHPARQLLILVSLGSSQFCPCLCLALDSDNSVFILLFSSSVITRRSANSCRMTSVTFPLSSTSLSRIWRNFFFSEFFFSKNGRRGSNTAMLAHIINHKSTGVLILRNVLND